MKDDCARAREILARDRTDDDISVFPLGRLQRDGRL
jgi:hypothetical protein